jgi:hypothetical protein
MRLHGLKRNDPQIGQIGQIKEAHAKALRGKGTKERKESKPFYLCVFAFFAPLREPLF